MGTDAPDLSNLGAFAGFEGWWPFLIGGVAVFVGIGMFLSYDIWVIHLIRKNFPVEKLNFRWIGPALGALVAILVLRGIFIVLDILLAVVLLYTIYRLIPNTLWKGFFRSDKDGEELLDDIRKKAQKRQEMEGLRKK